MPLHLALVAAVALQSGSPVGSYKPDVSMAPKASRDILNAYFGRAYLVVKADGSFELCGIRQTGYWRQSGSRTVLVFGGFFGIPFTESPEALRKQTPKNHAEGLILSKGSAGTMVLRDWGRVQGPIVFRPMPRRSMTDLLVASGGDEITAAMEEALTVLEIRMEREWPEVLAFIKDSRRTWPQRRWAAIVIGGLRNKQGIEAIAETIDDPAPSLEPRQVATLRRNLARAVAKHPTARAADLLLAAQEKGLLEPSDVAPALAPLKRTEDIPILIDWLSSSGEYDKIESLTTLSLLDAREALPRARELTKDEEESVRLEAHGLVARLSPDPMERKAAVEKLATWIKSSEFLLPFNAVEALCRSKQPEALPFLVSILGSDIQAIYRRNTAMALGDLGDLRAVPALLEARRRSEVPGAFREEAEVRAAAAAALRKLAKLKTSDQ